MVEKRCRICGEVKPIEQFHRAAQMRDGRRGECIECKRRLDAERYASTRRAHLMRNYGIPPEQYDEHLARHDPELRSRAAGYVGCTGGSQG